MAEIKRIKRFTQISASHKQEKSGGNEGFLRDESVEFRHLIISENNGLTEIPGLKRMGRKDLDPDQNNQRSQL